MRNLKRMTGCIVSLAMALLWCIGTSAQDQPIQEINSNLYEPLKRESLSDEEMAGKIAEQQATDFKSLSEVPRIHYIREAPPNAQLPMITGEYYEALVPDTCDLAAHADLFIQHVIATTAAHADYEPYGNPSFFRIPPRFQLHKNEGLCGLPKYRESLPLMRIMTGNQNGLAIDSTWAKAVLKSIGPDGLYYLPVIGRPWDTGAYSWIKPEAGGGFYAYLPTSNGRLLGALAEYYQLTGDEIWMDVGEGIVDRMNELAIDLPNGRAFFHKQHFYPGEEIDQEIIDQAIKTQQEQTVHESEKNTVLWQTWMLVGLAQFYGASGYEPARELAYKLVRYQQDNRYTKQWESHFHCISLGIHAMAELALVCDDMELAEYALDSYEIAKTSEKMIHVSSIGFFVNNNGGPAYPMEGCSIGDMATIAATLSKTGVADLWDDVDAYARNFLIEAQITRPEQVQAFCEKVGNATEPVKYNQLGDRFAERMVGMWSTQVLPTDLWGRDLPENLTCCSGNCSRALYYVWKSIVEFEEDAVQVNLLLNRSSKWADIDSYLPYIGRVDVHMKQTAPLKIRLNGWIDKTQVSCEVNSLPHDYRMEGPYVILDEIPAGRTVTLEFPVTEHVEYVDTYNLEYRIAFRGADAIEVEALGDITPRTKYSKIFQRDHYQEERPRFVKKRRFVADRMVK